MAIGDFFVFVVQADGSVGECRASAQTAGEARRKARRIADAGSVRLVVSDRADGSEPIGEVIAPR